MKQIKLMSFIVCAILLCTGSALVQEHKNGEVWNPDGIEMVYVEGKAGTVILPAIKGFYIGKYEVTQAEWKAVMGSNPSGFRGDNSPVEKVSWNDVQSFIKKLNSMTGRKLPPAYRKRMGVCRQWR